MRLFYLQMMMKRTVTFVIGANVTGKTTLPLIKKQGMTNLFRLEQNLSVYTEKELRTWRRIKNEPESLLDEEK